MNSPQRSLDSIWDLSPQLANLRSYWLGWGSPDSPDADLPIFRSGLPHPLLNGVLRVRNTPLDDAVAEMRRRLGAVPSVWWVGPDSDPGVADGLRARGAVLRSTLPIMAIPLDRLADSSVATGLAIERVTGREMMTEYVEAYSASFRVPATALHATVDAEVNYVSQRSELVRFVGRLDGRVVGTSELSISHGVAGVYWVSTLEPYRGRGIGTALTVAALLEARERGLRIGTLQASKLGRGVYERMGFVAVGECHHFGL